MTQAQFLDQLNHCGIADEQVVIATLQMAPSYRKGRRLAAQEGGLLEDLSVVALLGQFVSGGQTSRAASNDANSHNASSLAW
jgi:hypothetical protein